ncbi:interleukin-2 receptor subunit beta [Kryptolebias marmoratus]|uniref:interleukin-2 receptor subunit beta n=1 Tax=Kryptolebias marmoratus TaxID=37003 RepID=UPI0007F8B063|nr:interleukin-2 receptor subunit beta [Kryptolebias marmoratus]XP_037834780.1 interleukin-2 receptor subunit beta [Kryptolebias marmoratus]
MKMLPSLCLLVVLVPANSAHKSSPGLLCTNDYVNNVSCSWNGSWPGSVEDCWISGTKISFKGPKFITQSCKMKQHRSSPPGCSFVFEGTQFSGSEQMPVINMKCNGTLIHNITNYRPASHIKMHPPAAPRVNITVNDTLISWSLREPVSYFFRSKFDFQVQVKQTSQTWTEAMSFQTLDQKLVIPVWTLQGALQVRVRVKPSDRENCHWSNWSPTTSWDEASDKLETSTKRAWWMDQTSLMVTGVFLTLCVVFAVMTFYKTCKNRKLLKKKPVPNPSKYLENIHGGNLKSWSSRSEFVFVPPCDHISPVEVCEDWGGLVPSSSPSSSSTSALLYSHDYPPSASDSSGVAYNSSSLSTFSNMGYFMSSSSGGSARTEPHPAYFTYNDPFAALPQPPQRHAPSSAPDYESLKREPESPDSGFGLMEEQEEDRSEHSSAFLILPLHFNPRTCPPSSSSPPPPPPLAVAQISADRQQLDVPESAAAAAMSRSSSMPIEPFKSDYLTLKELQTTFSNKSI